MAGEESGAPLRPPCSCRVPIAHEKRMCTVQRDVLWQVQSAANMVTEVQGGDQSFHTPKTFCCSYQSPEHPEEHVSTLLGYTCFSFALTLAVKKNLETLAFQWAASTPELPAGLGPSPCPTLCVGHKGMAVEEEGAWIWGPQAAQALQSCSRPRGQ